MKVLVLAVLFTASALGAPQLEIVGGTAGQITDYPYNVAVLENGDHVCGGALVSDKYAISAAQCVADSNGEIKNKVYSIRYGSNDHMSGGTVVAVASITIPGSYPLSGYDLALLRLHEPATFSDKAKAVLLPDATSKISVGSKANVTGWGAIKEGSASMVMQLQVVELEVLDQNQCAAYGSNEGTLCVGTQEGGKGPCTMDQGDPLVNNGKLIGIVSNSSGCGKEGYPGVFVNVASQREWIDYYIN